MNSIYIGNFEISRNSPPFIIAEAGINHNGQLDLAYRMISAAKSAGADCIKFQTFTAEEFVGDSNQTYTYMSQGAEVTESMLEMFKRYEFAREEWFKIKRRCDEEGILFLSTPQNVNDLRLLLEIGIPAVKIGSDDFTNIPLLKAYSKSGLPILVSCGMADLAEVYQALEALGTFEGYSTILLLCTSQYPTPPEDVNIRKLSALTACFPELVLGFSDHTQGSTAATLALGFGARVFEKHFTLDNNLPGPDHWFSEKPEHLKVWVQSIRNAYQMLGSSLVRPTCQEEDMRKLARRSIVALKEIEPGEQLITENLGLRRPGTGLPASMFDKVLGTKAVSKISRGQILTWGDFL